jgi:hypothetical protein
MLEAKRPSSPVPHSSAVSLNEARLRSAVAARKTLAQHGTRATRTKERLESATDQCLDGPFGLRVVQTTLCRRVETWVVQAYVYRGDEALAEHFSRHEP